MAALPPPLWLTKRLQLNCFMIMVMMMMMMMMMINGGFNPDPQHASYMMRFLSQPTRFEKIPST